MKISFFTHIIDRHNKNTTSILVSGFTLIELMVATTLFTIIMLMGVGSLIVSSNSAKASQKLRIAVDNVNFAMESMSRELRTGSYFYCGDSVNISDLHAVSDCSTGGDIIAFVPQQVNGSASRVSYELTRRDSNSTSFTLERCEFISSRVCTEVVSDDVNIDLLKFYVKGSVLTDNIQPSVKILTKGTVSVNNISTPFSLQTMSSQRSSEK